MVGLPGRTRLEGGVGLYRLMGMAPTSFGTQRAAKGRQMGDRGIVVISVAHHDPEDWASLVQSNPAAKILEVRVGDARPEATSLESLSRLAEENGLMLRMRE
jgi:hypothetical protein